MFVRIRSVTGCLLSWRITDSKQESDPRHCAGVTSVQMPISGCPNAKRKPARVNGYCAHTSLNLANEDTHTLLPRW